MSRCTQCKWQTSSLLKLYYTIYGGTGNKKIVFPVFFFSEEYQSEPKVIRSQIPSDSQFMIHGITFEEDDEGEKKKKKKTEIEYMKKAEI